MNPLLFIFSAGLLLLASGSQAQTATGGPAIQDSAAAPATAAPPSRPAATEEQEGESYTIEKPANQESPETLLVKSGEEQVQKHSRFTSFYSLLLPGLGEYKMGKKTLGKSLMLTDGLLWAGFGAALFLRSLIRDDLRAYLFTFGDCNGKKVSGRTAWDLTDQELELPLYVDSSAYYDERVYKPSRDTSMLKINFYWQWDNEKAHQRYYDLWRSANQAKVTAYYFLGAVVVARAASFISARYFLKNEAVKSVSNKTLSLNIHPAVIRGHSGLEMSVRF
jgi:hypothetical protein